MNKYFVLFTLPLLLLCISKIPALAAPTDIVPRGSTLLDAFATLAGSDAFGASDTPEDFLGEPLYTRAQLAHLLEHLVQDDPQKFARVQKDDAANAALQSALSALQPEINADGVDLSDADAVPARGASISGYVQPELRLRAGGDAQPATGAIGTYRVTALGNLRSNIRYAFSASNWAQDHRRVFDNDIGTHDFSGINEAYLELDGGRGLKVDLGRMYDRWGPGMRGATMLGDNAPPLTQLQVAFPFSLGGHAGRNFSYTQMVTSFKSNNERDFFAARRIGYTFSNQWYADFQESFLSDRAWSLQFAPFPDYYNIKNANIPVLGLREKNLDAHDKVAFNFTTTYATPDDGLRLYGQFLVHDLRSPGPKSGVTPRKIAYLVGGSVRPVNGTRLTLEYIFDDPTTYSSRTVGTQWEEGRYDELALPGGPNATEYYGRLEQHLGSKLTVTLEGRDRRRHDLSFPAPNATSLAATAAYATTKRSDIQVIFHDYRQDAFPIAPGIPVGNGFQPSNVEGNYGQRLRIRQLDLAYQFFFEILDTSRHFPYTDRVATVQSALIGAGNGISRFKGLARLDRRTKNLAKRLRPGDVAVLDHADLDALAARTLVDAQVGAVINAQPFITGKYPNRGPAVLAASHIPLYQFSESSSFAKLRDGDHLVIDDSGCLYANNKPVDILTAWNGDTIARATELARANLGAELEKFARNTLHYLDADKDLLLDPTDVPALRGVTLSKRHALVVVRGEGYKEDLAQLRPYLHDVRPVVIAVDGAADALLERGWTPDIILGDMDSVSDEALRCGAQLIVHAYRQADERSAVDAPGLARVQKLGLDADLFAVPGTSEDAALLLAYEHNADLIVAVGSHSNLEDFLDKGRAGMASTFLVRLKVGPRLVDARGVFQLHQPSPPGIAWAAMILSILFVMVVLIGFTPMGENMVALVHIWWRLHTHWKLP